MFHQVIFFQCNWSYRSYTTLYRCYKCSLVKCFTYHVRGFWQFACVSHFLDALGVCYPRSVQGTACLRLHEIALHTRTHEHYFFIYIKRVPSNQLFAFLWPVHQSRIHCDYLISQSGDKQLQWPPENNADTIQELLSMLHRYKTSEQCDLSDFEPVA